MNDNLTQQARLVVTRQRNTLQLLQITDCHIFETAQENLRGFNTRSSFEAVIAAIRESGLEPDLLLATGDLSRDGSAASYRYLAQQFDEFGVPVFWLPGNHDAAGPMQTEFAGKHVDASKHILAGAWQILMLDSTVPGEIYGCVSQAQMAFLDACLERQPDKHALVCLHHQAQETGSDWLDKKGLRKARLLRDRMAQHANIKGVLWGHVHQEYRRRIDGVEWLATPSTGVQFKPGSKNFTVDELAPGYRHLRLNSDGSIETRVHRIDRLDFNQNN